LHGVDHFIYGGGPKGEYVVVGDYHNDEEITIFLMDVEFLRLIVNGLKDGLIMNCIM
jgi:hypothetical protein